MKLLRVLDGEAVWPPPVWLMRQAGRYLPEYRAVRAEAGDFLKLCMNPLLAAEVTLQPVRRFGFDAAILFSDILVLPWAMGQGLTFAEGEGPRLPPLQSLEALRPGGAAARYAPVLETVRLVRAALAPQTALIGFCGGPFTVACYMLDGQGGGSFPRTRALAYEAGGLLDQVIDLLVEASVAYLQGQVAAGADCVMLFESWAGILPPVQFHRLVTLPNRRIAAALKVWRPGLKVVGFPRLAGFNLGNYAREAGVDAVALDAVTEPAAAIAACPAGTVLQGNLDPLLLKLGGAALEDGVKQVREAFRGRPHVFNLGHGVTPDVPPEHVAALVRAVRAA